LFGRDYPNAPEHHGADEWFLQWREHRNVAPSTGVSHLLKAVFCIMPVRNPDLAAKNQWLSREIVNVLPCYYFLNIDIHFSACGATVTSFETIAVLAI
jgi:hypothetical protein